MSIVMVCVYLVTSIFAGKENLIEITGESSVVSFSLMTALNFVAGILVLLQGVRMFLGEIVPAFKGFSDKIVPGAKPALDVPIFYSYAPIAVTIGFLSAMAGGKRNRTSGAGANRQGSLRGSQRNGADRDDDPVRRRVPYGPGA